MQPGPKVASRSLAPFCLQMTPKGGFSEDLCFFAGELYEFLETFPWSSIYLVDTVTF